MLFKIISDVHLEHVQHKVAMDIVDSIPNDRTDVLVIAGDFGALKSQVDGSDCLIPALRRICASFPHVVYVTGNHEYYDSKPEAVHTALLDFGKTCANFHWLNGQVVDINGVKFGGTTMWFDPNTPEASRYGFKKDTHPLNDFNLIDGAYPFICQQYDLGQSFFNNLSIPVDVMVTHHAPYDLSVHPSRKGHSLNCYYVTNMTRYLMTTPVPPKMWVHGHMHDPVNYRLGDTTVLSNPRNYPSRSQAQFNPGMLVQV